MSPADKGRIDFRILDRPDIPIRKYAAGDTIIAKGAVAREMFLLRKGRVDILIHSRTVEEIGPGGIFGEMALIDHAPRAAEVIARVDCEVVPIDEKLFVSLVQDAPYFALDVMRVLADRIRALDKFL
ncbi:MAG: cyclic nucleotide-binding domain-containing protein [Bauldia sp.]